MATKAHCLTQGMWKGGDGGVTSFGYRLPLWPGPMEPMGLCPCCMAKRSQTHGSGVLIGIPRRSVVAGGFNSWGLSSSVDELESPGATPYLSWHTKYPLQTNTFAFPLPPDCLLLFLVLAVQSLFSCGETEGSTDHIVPYHIMPCDAKLYHITPHHTKPHQTTPNHTKPHHTTLEAMRPKHVIYQRGRAIPLTTTMEDVMAALGWVVVLQVCEQLIQDLPSESGGQCCSNHCCQKWWFGGQCCSNHCCQNWWSECQCCSNHCCQNWWSGG